MSSLQAMKIPGIPLSVPDWKYWHRPEHSPSDWQRSASSQRPHVDGNGSQNAQEAPEHA